MSPVITRLTLATIAAAVPLSLEAPPARAQDAARISAIERQINALQRELQQMKQDLAHRDADLLQARRETAAARRQAAQGSGATGAQAPPASLPPVAMLPVPATPDLPAAPATPSPKGEVHIGGVTVQLGGFIEAAGIFRSRNEVADISSSWIGIPFRNLPQAHEPEVRGSAHQSRGSILVHGAPDNVTTVSAYFETDLQGAAPNANSNETNSYNPRLRQAYMAYDRSDLGIHVLAGQAWSLTTLYDKGLIPRHESPPLTIDGQYVPGFTFVRQPQLRVVKDLLNQSLWLGLSLESPQTVYSTTGYAAATTFPAGSNGLVLPTGAFANVNNPGLAGFAPTVNYSSDVAPDIVGKVAWDPGYGHYEVYGIARFMHDRVDFVGGGSNRTKLAGGVGAGMLVPVIPSKLEFRLGFLAGYGVGRYGASQLPDATIAPNGSPAPIPEIHALVGLVGHPTPDLDLYTYVGTEQARKTAFTFAGQGYGYGSPLFVNSGCNTELSPLACTGNTSGITQATVGGWWRFLHGDFGTMEFGAQYSYTRRQAFQGVGGAPKTDDSIVMLSLRYLPFQ
jgi:hypothetical protein